MSLAILVPSRGRPHNLDRLVNAIRSTATGPYAVYVRLDADDTARYAPYSGDVRVTTGPRIFYAASVNELAEQAVKDGHTHLAMFGDDVVPETVGWDRMLVDALGGNLGVAYGSDGLEHLHGPDLPTHFITQAEVYSRLGWLVLPTLRHLFADDVARELGKGLGNFQYVPEARMPHLHPWAHKEVVRDQTYREANDKRKRILDKRAFQKWRYGDGYTEAMRRLEA